MKTLSIYSILFVLLFTTMASTCENDDTNNNPPNTVQPVIDAATAGTWRITYYFDTDSEETSQFSNYNFTFDDGNVLRATNGTNTYTGSWSITNLSGDGSNDDSNDDSDLDFNIAFSSPSNFAELSDDWDIVSYSDTKIELIDVSGGNGGTDLLTFEKN